MRPDDDGARLKQTYSTKPDIYMDGGGGGCTRRAGITCTCTTAIASRPACLPLVVPCLISTERQQRAAAARMVRTQENTDEWGSGNLPARGYEGRATRNSAFLQQQLITRLRAGPGSLALI